MSATDILTHYEKSTHRYALLKDSINKVSYVKNRNWKELHDSMIVDKNRDLFDLDLLVDQNSSGNVDSPTLSINVDKKCMTELLLLDDTKFLSLFDTGSTVNLIS